MGSGDEAEMDGSTMELGAIAAGPVTTIGEGTAGIDVVTGVEGPSDPATPLVRRGSKRATDQVVAWMQEVPALEMRESRQSCVSATSAFTHAGMSRVTAPGVPPAMMPLATPGVPKRQPSTGMDQLTRQPSIPPVQFDTQSFVSCVDQDWTEADEGVVVLMTRGRAQELRMSFAPPSPEAPDGPRTWNRLAAHNTSRMSRPSGRHISPDGRGLSPESPVPGVLQSRASDHPGISSPNGPSRQGTGVVSADTAPPPEQHADPTIPVSGAPFPPPPPGLGAGTAGTAGTGMASMTNSVAISTATSGGGVGSARSGGVRRRGQARRPTFARRQPPEKRGPTVCVPAALAKPAPCRIMRAWDFLSSPATLDHVHSGGCCFACAAGPGDVLRDVERAIVASVIDLTQFGDELRDNGVLHVDMACGRDLANHIFLVTKGCYLLPRGTVPEAFTPQRWADVDFQKSIAPSGCKVHSKVYDRDMQPITTRDVFCTKKEVIPWVFNVTTQYRVSVLPSAQLEQLAALADGVKLSYGLLLERTKQDRGQDATVKAKQVILFHVPEGGGALVTNISFSCFTSLPSVVRKVIDKIGAKGAQELAEMVTKLRGVGAG